MLRRFFSACVAAVVMVLLAPLPGAATRQTEAITDPDAYAIYAAVIPSRWVQVSKDTLLLEEETVPVDRMSMISECFAHFPNGDAEWTAVLSRFKSENARVRRLERMLPVDISYRLIPRAEIVADDARLALKYPGNWQRRPESMVYAAVSAVGFDSAKTKAIFYLELRSEDWLVSMELQGGKWVPRSGGCSWIA